jgi:hypothetical protein
MSKYKVVQNVHRTLRGHSVDVYVKDGGEKINVDGQTRLLLFLCDRLNEYEERLEAIDMMISNNRDMIQDLQNEICS